MGFGSKIHVNDRLKEEKLSCNEEQPAASSGMSEARFEEKDRLSEFCIENLADAVFCITTKGHFRKVNMAACNQLGYSHEELLTLSLFDIDPDYTLENFRSDLDELKKTGSLRSKRCLKSRTGIPIPVEITFSYFTYYHDEIVCWVARNITERARAEEEASFFKSLSRKNGPAFPVEITANSLEHQGREYVFSFVKHITERKETEKALRQSEARLKMAMDMAKLAYWEYDWKTGMFAFNDQFYALYGTCAEIEGGMLMPAETYVRKFIPPEERSLFEYSKAQLVSVSSFQLEHRIIRADGKERFVVVRGEAVRDRTGSVVASRGINQDITERRRMEEELRKSRDELDLRVRERTAELERANEQLRSVPCRLIAVQEEERKRLAGELHDSIGQTLAALKLNVEFALGNPAQTPRILDRFVPILQRSIDETRSIYTGLRPRVLEDMGLIIALQSFCREFMGLYPKHHIELDMNIKEDDIPEPLKIVFFRIAQEALNNVARHSKAEWVDVSLSKNEAGIELMIADDGIGMDLDYILQTKTANSLGLIGMRERADLVGGDFFLDSSPGEGTTVRVQWNDQARKVSGTKPRF